MDEQPYSPLENGIRAAEKKPLDWVGFALSGIAVVLIIVGLYFLNQSVSFMGSKKNSSSSISSSSSVVSSSSSQVITSSQPSSESLSVSSSTSVSSSESVASSSSVSVSTSQVPEFDPLTAPLKSGSTHAEIKIQITAIDSSYITGTITETGFVNTRWFARPGVYWNQFDSTLFIPTPKIGEIWRLELTITANQSDGSLVQPGAITIVKAYKL